MRVLCVTLLLLGRECGGWTWTRVLCVTMSEVVGHGPYVREMTGHGPYVCCV